MTIYYAMIFDNKVAGIEKTSPYGKFEPNIQWVEYNPDTTYVEVGYIYNKSAGTFERERKSVQVEKQVLLKRLNQFTDMKLKANLVGYPELEATLTFPLQEDEVRRYYDAKKRGEEIDPSDVIFLSKLAKRRKMSLEVMMARTKYLIDLLSDLAADIVGDRQDFEDQLNALDTVEELDELWIKIDQWGGVR